MAVERPYKGLHTDGLKSDQPKDTYTFALNAVLEGESTFISNEESNEQCASLPTGFIPIGKIYLGNDDVVIFSVQLDEFTDITISEIGILDKNSNYKTVVNDKLSPDDQKLNFRIDKQIQGFYSLRRGCDRTIYFTDNHNKPRYFNFDKLENFKVNGTWRSYLFDLQRIYLRIPQFSDIKVLDSGGSLLPGSYNIGIQYLDDDLNPTEWIITSNIIKIYNDSISASYKTINGSVNSEQEYLQFGNTSKSIEVNLKNLDSSFPYYKLAFIEATSGTGKITSIKITDLIPKLIIDKTYSTESSFIYTGFNVVGEITEAEIISFNNIIERAKTITNLENRLHLGNISDKNISLCKLQKYASVISADCIVYNSIDSQSANNFYDSKNPTQELVSVGYMPGEIYSFGIVYIFEDNTLSPVYHIPGRSPELDINVIFSTDSSNTLSLFPMLVDDLTTDIYDSKTVNGENYWGVDVLGNKLSGEKIRHHKFPNRYQLGEHSFLHGTNTNDVSFLGIRFMNIQKPFSEEIGGLNIIGYYIVRNERTENTKTILDSAVMFPTLYYENKVAVGMVSPSEFDKAEAVNGSYIFGFINPEYKFNNIKHTDVDELLIEANFRHINTKYGKVCYRDVNDGTTYIKDKDKIEDKNGWAIEISSRDSDVRYYRYQYDFNIDKSLINEIFYLDALESRKTNDNKTEVFNVSSDNKIGVISLNKLPIDNDNSNFQLFTKNDQLPYFTFKRKLKNPYSNFRLLPYYLEDGIPRFFNQINNKVESINLFHGDVYISSMRYVSTIFYENKKALRQIKSQKDHNFLRIIGGIFLALAGAVLAAFTGGTSVILSEIGISLIGGGALLASSGLKEHNYKSTYHEAYDNGLRKAISKSAWVTHVFDYQNNNVPDPFYISVDYTDNANGIEDDTIQWIGDCLTNLWFESTVNIGLRSRMSNDGTPSFLNSPGVIENGNDSEILSKNVTGFFSGVDSSDEVDRILILSTHRPEKSELEHHLVNKLLRFSDKRQDGMQYLGVAMGELYYINPDYNRKNKQKIFYHLPIEYDCDSNCKEKFPHRWYWSQQSFQEELSDNYRTFLPNNYKDIPGETGEIMNVFAIGNNMYIHTKEALWLQPRNYQERVTDQIVSFIGTGSYGDIPPRKIINDETGMSAGLSHRWSALNIKYGYFFVSEKERKIYKFDGERLTDLSLQHLSEWFNNNVSINLDSYINKKVNEEYAYKDNPSNKNGTGYLLTYDSDKERILVTKKDYISENKDLLLTSNLISFNGSLISFDNYQDIINDNKKDGWYLSSIEQGKLEFNKFDLEDSDINVYKKLFNDPKYDIHIFYPSTLSNQVILDYVTDVSKEDNVYVHINDTGKWLEYPKFILDNYNSRKVVLISFDSNSVYHNNPSNSNDFELNTLYHDDYNTFVSDLYVQFDLFLGIHYPVESNENHIYTLENAINGNKNHSNPNISENQLINYGWTTSFVSGNFGGGGDAGGFGFGDEGGSKIQDVETEEKDEPEDEFENPPESKPAPTKVIPGSVARTPLNMLVHIYVNSHDCNPTRKEHKYWMEKKSIIKSDDLIHLSIYKSNDLVSASVWNGDGYTRHTIWFDDSSRKYLIDYDIKKFRINHASSCSTSASVVPPTLMKIFIIKNEICFPKEYRYAYFIKKISGSIDPTTLNSKKIYLYNNLSTPATSSNLPDGKYTIWYDDKTMQKPFFSRIEDGYIRETIYSVNVTKCNKQIKPTPTPKVVPTTVKDLKKDIRVLISQTIKREIKSIKRPVIQVKHEAGKDLDLELIDNSWTLSHDLKTSKWISWHSYIPNFYIDTSNKLYSWIHDNDNKLWRHNVKGHYQSYYGEQYAHILEYVSTSLTTKIWESFRLITEARKYDSGDYVDKRLKSFNKLVLYNSRQCTGLLTLKTKDKSSVDYLENQVKNDTEIILNRAERDWYLNNFRDIRINYDLPIWLSDPKLLKDNYFIDKVLNQDSLDINKNWYQLESFRDKYLVIRLIFDDSTDIKLVTNYYIDNPKESER